MMIIIASVAVALAAFIIYALDRRSKEQPIEWDQAGKISILSGLITSGVVFSTTAELPAINPEIVKNIADNLPSTEDMFVGSPSF